MVTLVIYYLALSQADYPYQYIHGSAVTLVPLSLGRLRVQTIEITKKTSIYMYQPPYPKRPSLPRTFLPPSPPSTTLQAYTHPRALRTANGAPPLRPRPHNHRHHNQQHQYCHKPHLLGENTMCACSLPHLTILSRRQSRTIILHKHEISMDSSPKPISPTQSYSPVVSPPHSPAQRVRQLFPLPPSGRRVVQQGMRLVGH